ncbi:DUF6364 family protein [Hymenobacter sp.]|uniref:DUF6364 family protein n=1 Tax=Hymenobacter sp. TaxID=1898978 RepID=UPI002869F487|nr:DUF6364 family protein [Hymenobacter sp.]
MSQLTINLDDNLLVAAQAYAHQKGQDLDALVADLLQTAVQAAAFSTQPTRPLSPRVQRLFGSLKVSPDFNYKAELGKALDERFGV